MSATPIHLNGPFTLAFEQQAAWVIRGQDGVPICEVSRQLIDGSNRTEKYPDGMIRTLTERAEEANYVLAAMNAAYEAFNK